MNFPFRTLSAFSVLTILLLVCSPAGLRGDDHYQEMDVSFEDAEGYIPGSLMWQNGWLVAGSGSQATVVEDAGEAPHGDRFLRLTREAGENAIRARNSKDRAFTPDGVISWYMKNNSPDARGDINLRVPINGASSNLLQVQIQGEVNGDFREGRLRYLQDEGGSSPIWRVAPVDFPREEWMHWRAEFFSSDPSNPHMHITLTRVSDGEVIWSVENLHLSEPFSYNAKWGRLPEMVETITAFDMVSIGSNPHDFSYDRFRTEASWPSGYGAWRTANFGETEREDPSISGPEADPGGYGIPNLIRYALGLEPRDPNPTALPGSGLQTVQVGGEPAEYATLSFARPKGLSDVTYVVQASADLVEWIDLDESHLVETEDLGDSEKLIWRDSVPSSEAGRRFLRLLTRLDSSGQ